MIKKISFGNPFNTDAVINKEMAVASDKTALLPFESEFDRSGHLILSMDVSKDAVMYGLGEANRGINKRGYVYESNCSDDPNHTEEKISLYGAHNFLIIDEHKSDTTPFGIFLDTPSKTRFDVCFTKYDKIVITTSEDVDIYIIDSPSYKEIVTQFRKLTGSSYIPPMWAFGYQQCRWSYYSADEIREVVKKHRENNIPLDAVYMDIDYMEGYKDFTVNDETFPDFDNFVKEMKDDGIHLVPIIDAGVKIEEGYDVYEEGVKGNYFCKDAEGNDYIAAVWPGYTHFPDFLNPAARKWFGDKYSFLIDKGIDGFWNDMNEPAIFYTPYGIKRVMEKLEGAKDFVKSLGTDCSYQDIAGANTDALFKLKDELNNLPNNTSDYANIYHNVNGKMISHEELHNIYGYNMTRAAGESISANYPDKRFLLFSRSSYIGMHRYGGIWTGDNQAWWSHLLLNIKMMPSLNMCGFMYTGADIGGFGSNTSRDLVLRWLAFGIFTPLMRNHSALGTRRQEFYQFENPADFKDIIDIRYALIPYLYSEFVKAALNDGMFIKPLAFEYQDDDMAANVEDQLIIGDSIMAAPVYTQNAKGRYVYIPEDMLYIKFRGWNDKECCVMKKGHHYIDVALNEVPIFVRKNHLLPLASPCEKTSDIDTSSLNVFCHLEAGANAAYSLYEDDGYSKCVNDKKFFTDINVSLSGDGTYSVDTTGDKKKEINLTVL